MDAITISMLAAAVTAIAIEVGKGSAHAVGKDLWEEIKQILGLKPNISPEEVESQVTTILAKNPELGDKVYKVLQTSKNSSVKQLVGKIKAKNVTVANEINIDGDFKMN